MSSALSVSRLFNRGVDEQLICNITGHTSNGVKEYKHVSDGLKKQVSDTLQCVTSNQETDEKEKIKTETIGAKTLEL